MLKIENVNILLKLKNVIFKNCFIGKESKNQYQNGNFGNEKI